MKLPTPQGDLTVLRRAQKGKAFPHGIKNPGQYEQPASYLAPKPLKLTTGLPTPVETRVAPGIGAAGPSGRKSVAWKAVVCADENARMGPIENRQVLNVDGNLKFQSKAPSRFAATVGPRGPQGINTGSDMEKFMFGHKNMRMSNLDGTGGPSARTSKWAAVVSRSNGGPARITTKEETFGGGVLKNKKVKNI